MSEAIIVKKKIWRISPVWFLPFTALLMAIWLAYESYINQGISVKIYFSTGSGISVNKTKVMYKGIQIGKVSDIQINKQDIQQVIVTVLLDKRTRPYLLDDTEFWLVKPSVSLGGISGLDTLVSGNYIAIKPGTQGKEKLEFTALNEAPIEAVSKSGLYIQLLSRDQGSFVEHSPVYYKKFKIGEVLGSKFNIQTQQVVISIKIDNKYRSLVKRNSRFYKASGIRVRGGLSGFKLETESLATVVMGGITMYTPENSKVVAQNAENNDKFPLFRDFEEANIGIPIILKLSSAEGLEEEITEIRYKGKKVGIVRKIMLDRQSKQLSAQAFINPVIDDLLTTGTKIWKVTPVVKVSRVAGLDTLLRGVYLNIRPGEGQPNRIFTVYEQEPELTAKTDGLHLQLTAKNLGSIQRFSGIYYKNIQIGHVKAFELDQARDQVMIRVFIEPEYQHFITTNTHFYRNSGITIKGSISNMSIKAESLNTIISGGISIYNPDTDKPVVAAVNGDTFVLHEDRQASNSAKTISIYFDDVQGIHENITRIRYNGINVGYVDKIVVEKNIQRIKVVAKIFPIASRLMKEQTQFWLVSPKIGLDGISGLDTLVGGSYITFRPGKGRASKQFIALSEPPYEVQSNEDLKIRILASRLGSVSKGSPILYQQMQVGVVTGYRLASDNQQVEILASIYKPYRHLVRDNTRFYNVSGIEVRGSLSNIQVNTESLMSLVKGGIAFITPGISAGNRKKQHLKQRLFKLYRDFDHARQNRFKVYVSFPDASGIQTGTRVKYQGMVVGEVIGIRFKDNLQRIQAEIELDDYLKKHLGRDSVFSVAKANFGLAKTEHLDTLIAGNFIQLKPVKGRWTAYFNAHVDNFRPGKTFFLKTSRLGSIKVGNPVTYRQIQVGEVISYRLSEFADHVMIKILIYAPYSNLVRTNSQFWNASGIDMDINLFSSSKVRTESLQAILDGGIAFATPDTIRKKDLDSETASEDTKAVKYLAAVARQNQIFELADEVEDEWLQWQPQIRISP